MLVLRTFCLGLAGFGGGRLRAIRIPECPFDACLGWVPVQHLERDSRGLVKSRDYKRRILWVLLSVTIDEWHEKEG